MQQRLLERAKDDPRPDDGKVKKRFKIFVEKTMPVVQYYERHRKLVKIDTGGYWVDTYNKIKDVVKLNLGCIEPRKRK
jgi:UMP-CMP kinase